MTRTDLDSLLAAVVAHPDDDTLRLAYADCAQENGDDERAEFVRVQVVLARHERVLANKETPFPDGFVIFSKRHKLRARESELLDRNRAAWSRWACPKCIEKQGTTDIIDTTCPACSGTGDLFHGLTVTFRRGFPFRVTAPTLETWVRLETLGAGPTRVGMGYRPTPRLLACLAHTTAREFGAGDRHPLRTSGFTARFRAQDTMDWVSQRWQELGAQVLPKSVVPVPIFDIMCELFPDRREGAMDYFESDTLEAAYDALARAVGEFGRGATSPR